MKTKVRLEACDYEILREYDKGSYSLELNKNEFKYSDGTIETLWSLIVSGISSGYFKVYFFDRFDSVDDTWDGLIDGSIDLDKLEGDRIV